MNDLSRARVQPTLPPAYRPTLMKLLLPSILFFALIVRVWGIDFGLPYRYHVDEQAYVPQAARLCTGEFDLPAYSFGPNLYLITLCAVDVATYASGLATGAWNSPTQFRAAYDVDPTFLYVVNRAVSAFSGTATVWLIYLLGNRLGGRQVGLLAAVFLASAFLHARDSHYAVPDIYVTFWIVLTAYAADRAYEKKTLKDWAFAGTAAGVAAGVKFTALTALAMPVAALSFVVLGARDKHHKIRPAYVVGTLALICAAFGVGFLIGYPNALKLVVDSESLFEDLTYQLTFMRQVLATIEAHTLPAPLFYIWSLDWAMGLPLAITGLIGIGNVLYKRSHRSMIVLVFVASYYLLISTAAWYTAHYALPLIPFFCLFATIFAVDRIRQVKSFGYRRVMAWSVPLLIILPSLLAVFRSDRLLTMTDTRTLAKEWIESNIPEGAHIGVSVYTPWAPPLSTKEEPAPYSTHTYDVTVFGYDLSEHTLDAYRQMGVEYLVTSSFVTELAWREGEREIQKQQWYRELVDRSALLQEFAPGVHEQNVQFIHDEVYGPAISLWQRERPGPDIRIYQIAQ